MICIIQARTNSTRLPNKIFKEIEDKYAIQHLIDRLRYSKLLDDIIITTTTNKCDDIIVTFCENNQIKYYRGNEKNVLDRYYKTALKYDVKTIMRITSDCVLMDPFLVDNMIKEYNKQEDKRYFSTYYYGSQNGLERGFPDGFNPEIFSFEVLEEAWLNAIDDYDKEHVTPYIRKHYTNLVGNYVIKINEEYKNIDLTKLHLSLDTDDDLRLIKKIYKELYYKDKVFRVGDILNYLDKNNLY